MQRLALRGNLPKTPLWSLRRIVMHPGRHRVMAFPHCPRGLYRNLKHFRALAQHQDWGMARNSEHLVRLLGLRQAGFRRVAVEHRIP